MILLLILLALFSAFFAVILEKEELSLENKTSRYLTHLIFIALGMLVFVLYYWNSGSLLLIITAGIIYILISLIYLDIFANKYFFNHFSIHLILNFILNAIVNISWYSAILILLIFIMTYLGLFYMLNRLINDKLNQSDNIKQLFELGRILNGIYLLIIGVIMATDRIEFLEKLARYLF